MLEIGIVYKSLNDSSMNTSQKPQLKAKASQVILFAFLVLSSTGLAGILSSYEGLITVKVGIQGGEITIDGRNDAAPPKNLLKSLQ
jgi:hypothetical protein